MKWNEPTIGKIPFPPKKFKNVPLVMTRSSDTGFGLNLAIVVPEIVKVMQYISTGTLNTMWFSTKANPKNSRGLWCLLAFKNCRQPKLQIVYFDELLFLWFVWYFVRPCFPWMRSISIITIGLGSRCLWQPAISGKRPLLGDVRACKIAYVQWSYLRTYVK